MKNTETLRWCNRRTGAAALLVLLPTAYGACRPVADTDASPVIRVGVGVGSTVKATSIATLTGLLYTEALVERGVDGRPEPALAESWAWEDNGRRIRLRLKSGVRFHDGRPLTAELVERILNEQIAAARSDNETAFDTVLRIEHSGDDIVAQLTQPDALLLSELFGLPIAPPDAPDIGTGPFVVAGRADDVIQTKRFEQYHGGRSALGGVTLISYGSQRSAWAALMRGEVDAVQEVSRSSVEFLEGSSNARTYPVLQPFYIPLVFNLRHAALGQPEVRRAIIEGLNRDLIVDKAMHGHGRVADGPIWPLHWAYAADHPRYTYDPQRAADRLERAGFPLKRARAQGRPDSRFSFRCVFWSEDPLYERIALMIQRQLFDLGIAVELEPATLTELLTRASSGDFDTFLARTNASHTLNLTYRFWHSTAGSRTAMQRSGYSGADQLLDQLRQSTTDAAVREAVRALSHRFYEDAPAAFIAWTEITRAVDVRFHVPEGAEEPFAKIWLWRPTQAGEAQ